MKHHVSRLREQSQLYNSNYTVLDEKSIEQVMFYEVKCVFGLYVLGNYILLSNNMQCDDVVNI